MDFTDNFSQATKEAVTRFVFSAGTHPLPLLGQRSTLLCIDYTKQTEQEETKAALVFLTQEVRTHQELRAVREVWPWSYSP